mmetsp:Transcript_27213/g.41398  ORF Transcript_27213/g.41398 Transcript_27213/m.41398 type:complete len:84 (+) Transcript_27213:891-1142(+)
MSRDDSVKFLPNVERVESEEEKKSNGVTFFAGASSPGKSGGGLKIESVSHLSSIKKDSSFKKSVERGQMMNSLSSRKIPTKGS